MSFVHLHVYSAYSLLSSTATVEQLVQDAKKKGFSSIALTDQNVMYGTIAFYKECLQQGLKPIIGLTVDVLSERSEGNAYPLVLLAKNNDGYENLLKITSVVQTKSPQGIPFKWLRAYSNSLIGITPGIKGEIEQCLLRGEVEEAQTITTIFKEIFAADDFYFGMQKHESMNEIAVNEQLLSLAEMTGIKIVATNEVHYLQPSDAFAHECLLAIKNGEKLEDESREQLDGTDYYLKTAAEMNASFQMMPSAVEASVEIAEKCNVSIELDKKNLPKYPLPQGENAEDLLEQLCWEGFHERYSTSTKEHEERLRYELQVIKKMNFADYFLIVWDFMKFSRENGILTGPGRGSAAGSIVAYVLFITDVDPIEHSLLFERFLNPERISMPDIDIDFPDHRRDEVIAYVAKKYGDLHVAQIITFGTLAAKAVIRDVGRVFGLNAKQLDMLSRFIPNRLGITLETAYKESAGLRNFVSESEMNQRLFSTARKLEGLPRHTSIHAAGVVISEHPLVQSIPIQAGHDDVYLTQYSMEHLEDVGLLKMDFLGLRNLSLIERILESISRSTGEKVKIKDLPLDDGPTFELLSKGETTGVFQLESDGMKSVLKRLKPSRFEDIVAVNALYRPGPMENIPQFIERKHGHEKITYPHPDLETILKNTYGVIVYQEQIMQIASKMAGFSLGEADLLRRAVSKKQKSVLDKEREHFVSGAIQKGYSVETANAIYDLIVKFANYGFNRSHAVAYSLIAYQLAYLKAHYPLYFMAALLSAVAGNERRIAQYIHELTDMNLSILPPSINTSGYTFLVEKGKIRYSLAAIKGIGASALKEIFQARKMKKFVDLFDFCIRVSPKAVNRKALEALVHSGSFDEFGVDRSSLLLSLDVALKHAQLITPDEMNQGDLFAEEELSLKPKYVQTEPIRIEDKLQFEKEVLGVYLSDHPVSVYEKYYLPLQAKQLALLSDQTKQERAIAYVTEVKKIRTKKGEAMAFLTINDQSGDLEAVVFPDVYKKTMEILQKGSIIFLQGKIEYRNEKRQFVIQHGQAIEEAIEHVHPEAGTLFLKITTDFETIPNLKQLKELLSRHSGSVEVIMYYESSERTIRLGAEDRVSLNEEFLTQLKTILGEKNVIFQP